jgi:tetratricopeptide (TPR) repeat protein
MRERQPAPIAAFTAAGIRASVAGAVALSMAACASGADRSPGERPPIALRQAPPLGATSLHALERTIAEARDRLATRPDDVAATVRLAEALLRQARATGHGGPAVEAERALVATLARRHAEPDEYSVRRLLAATYLSQHRFREALAEAARCQAMRPDDAWIHGVAGDAHLELGEYDRAFDAFDRMNAIKPTAASYARASYARELQGDLAAAVEYMGMALEATSPADVEALAWHRAHLGHLHFTMGRLTEAGRQYAHAERLFPGHPIALDGLARVAAASGQPERALEIVGRRLAHLPLPGDFALAGDLLLQLGKADEAERHYRLAEAAWRSDAPEPGRLARFLAERGRRLDQAVALAESVRGARSDIFTTDTLAWAYLQTGRLDKAQASIADALRTGTRDRTILFHAAAIARAAGDRNEALRLAAAALDGFRSFDPIAAPAAAALHRDLSAARVARR